MKLRQTKHGQSLMETVFAIGILLIVVIAVLALTIANLTGQKESELQIVANNLARESIEVVRSIRDSNWLSEARWDQGLDGGVEAITDFDESANQWMLIFNPSVDADKLYLSSNDVYSHDATGQPTVFRRSLTIESICQPGSGEELTKTTCDAGEKKVGIKVGALVSWIERDRNRSVSLVDFLYEWK